MKPAPTHPRDYTGAVTYRDGCPHMGGAMITPWDWRSVRLSSDLGMAQSRDGINPHPGPATPDWYGPFMAYFWECRGEAEPGSVERRQRDEIAALERRVASSPRAWG